jgi:hypothetical protein
VSLHAAIRSIGVIESADNADIHTWGLGNNLSRGCSVLADADGFSPGDPTVESRTNNHGIAAEKTA